MVSPSSFQINEMTKMSAAADVFVCPLCKFIVEPFPRECPDCNTLFCKSCISRRMIWQCPVGSCRSSQQPIDMHRSVKEILELATLTCPGCGVSKKYEKMFEHVQTCPEIKHEEIKGAEDIPEVPKS